MRIRHDGCGCPINNGDKVRMWLRDGSTVTAVMRHHDACNQTGPIFFNGQWVASAWCWAFHADLDTDTSRDVIAYELLDVPREELYQTARAPRSAAVSRMINRYASQSPR